VRGISSRQLLQGGDGPLQGGTGHGQIAAGELHGRGEAQSVGPGFEPLFDQSLRLFEHLFLGLQILAPGGDGRLLDQDLGVGVADLIADQGFGVPGGEPGDPLPDPGGVDPVAGAGEVEEALTHRDSRRPAVVVYDSHLAVHRHGVGALGIVLGEDGDLGKPGALLRGCPLGGLGDLQQGGFDVGVALGLAEGVIEPQRPRPEGGEGEKKWKDKSGQCFQKSVPY